MSPRPDGAEGTWPVDGHDRHGASDRAGTSEGHGPPGARVALVFAGGEASPPGVVADVGRGALVVAADSGAVHARREGRAIDVLVGDFDSIPPALLAELEAAGVDVRRHPVDKDRTDLALALDAAVAAGATELVVVGGHGGRLDHELANALLLAAEEYAPYRVEARWGAARLTVVRGRRELRGGPGELLSLLPLGGPAVGVTTEGLDYPLHDAELHPGVTWGVSNRFGGPSAAVSVARGVLLAVQPGPER